MAIVKKKRITWTPAPDAAIVKHRVYVTDGVDIDPKVDQYIEVLMPHTSILLPDEFPAGTFEGEGNYIIGVSAIDDVGNEGDLAIVASPFDFIAPGVPTNLVVENV
jgi:hypothetical protein